MRILLLVSCWVMIFSSIQAQMAADFGELRDHYPIYVSYWGESFFHPGMKIQYNHILYSKGVFKEKKNKYKHRDHQFYAGPHLGYFIHPGNHQGLVIGTDVGYRIIKAKTKEAAWKGRGFVFDVFVNVDYFLQINNGPTYTTDEAGEVRKVPSARSYFMPGTGIGLGYCSPNFEVLLRPNVSFQMPYSANVLPRGLVELAFYVPILKIN